MGPEVFKNLGATLVHIFLKKSESCLKILGARNITWRKDHTEDVQIRGTTEQSSVAWGNWWPGFVYPGFNSTDG